MVLIHVKLFGYFDIHVEDRDPAAHLFIAHLCPLHGNDKSIVCWTEWISLMSFPDGSSGYFENHNDLGDYYATAFAAIYKIDRPDKWKIERIKSIWNINQQNDIIDICNNIVNELRIDEKKRHLNNGSLGLGSNNRSAQVFVTGLCTATKYQTS
jgi:hypothetical protein